MLGHYLRTIAHNLAHSKLVTLMHIVGLGVGLACFIVTFVFIQELRTSDTQFRASGRIYAITQEMWMGTAANPVVPASPGVTPVAAPYIRTDFPQLEAVARAVRFGLPGSGRVAVSSGGHNLFLYDVMVDPDFFRIFNLPFVAGDRAAALAGSDGAIITEAAARRVFGATNVLGRRLLIDNQTWITIKAVIAGVPQPSHMGDAEQSILRFDILTRLTPKALGRAATDWDENNSFTYVLLPKHGFTAQQLRAGLRDFSARHMPRAQGHSLFGVVPVSSIQLSALAGEIGDSGISVVASLALLDALVLLVACFNYASLATAVALRRGREIALRKIVGANRGQLVLQCLLEAAAVSVLAVALAFVLVLAATPLLDTVLLLKLQLSQLARPGFWLFLVSLIALTTVLAGAYPALILSRLSPAQALRSDSPRTGSRWAFKTLVGAQFAAAGFLMVMVLVVRDQNELMGKSLPALMRNPTVVITTDLLSTKVNEKTLRSELERSPYIRSVGTTNTIPWGGGCCWLFNVTRSPSPGQREIQVAANRVGYDFFETIGLKLLAGRAFDRNRADEADRARAFYSSAGEIKVIIDESLAAKFGWSDPGEAVGKTVYRAPLFGAFTTPLRIIGVVDNGAPRLTTVGATDSNLYLLMPSLAGYPIVRIDPQHIRAALAHIESSWHVLAPTVPLEWRFSDELFGEAFETFTAVSAVMTGLAAFAFAIALIGLAGMALHVTNSRLHELGIRKTLGATPRQVIELLLLDFAAPVAIANLITWPFAWLAARAYLSLFLARIDLTPVVFIASLAATVAIACLAVGGQALRASRVEPATALRYQ
ncbi:MAG: ABC transporter permease [Steroidobacteraceae bacterium]